MVCNKRWMFACSAGLWVYEGEQSKPKDALPRTCREFVREDECGVKQTKKEHEDFYLNSTMDGGGGG